MNYYVMSWMMKCFKVSSLHWFSLVPSHLCLCWFRLVPSYLRLCWFSPVPSLLSLCLFGPVPSRLCRCWHCPAPSLLCPASLHFLLCQGYTVPLPLSSFSPLAPPMLLPCFSDLPWASQLSALPWSVDLLAPPQTSEPQNPPQPSDPSAPPLAQPSLGLHHGLSSQSLLWIHLTFPSLQLHLDPPTLCNVMCMVMFSFIILFCLISSHGFLCHGICLCACSFICCHDSD